MKSYGIDTIVHRQKKVTRFAAIGAFDGLHIGHRQLIRAAGHHAKEMDGELLVVTFWPPPQLVMSPGRHPSLLQTRRQKERELCRLGVDVLITLPFEHSLARMSPRQFARNVLVQALQLDWVYVGFNFKFGDGGKGDVQTLRELGAEMGFSVEVFPPVRSGGEPISSTRIRRLLRTGKVIPVRELLGRRYQVEGEVIRGRGRGSEEIGYPTANVVVNERLLLPAAGVYSGSAETDGEAYSAVINVGGSPTFGSCDSPPVEVHLIGFQGRLYGKSLQLHFQRRLRDLQKFECPGELARQIEVDIRRATSHGPYEAADDG